MTTPDTIKKEIKESIYYLKDNDSLSLTGKQLREWKGFIEEGIKEKIIEELIESRNKYGLEWCDTLFINHIKKIKQ